MKNIRIEYDRKIRKKRTKELPFLRFLLGGTWGTRKMGPKMFKNR